MAEHLHPADSLYAESCGKLVQACKTNKMRWSDMIETWDISKPVWYPGWPGDPAGDAEVSLQSSFGFQSPDNEFVSTSRVFWLGLTENEKKMDARVEAKRAGGPAKRSESGPTLRVPDDDAANIA